METISNAKTPWEIQFSNHSTGALPKTKIHEKCEVVPKESKEPDEKTCFFCISMRRHHAGQEIPLKPLARRDNYDENWQHQPGTRSSTVSLDLRLTVIAA